VSETHAHPGLGWRESHPPPGPASLLDIGGDVGAVVVQLPADPPTGELTACRRGDPAAHFHTGVHRREVGDSAAWVAVFPDVTEGDYSLLNDDGVEHTPFSVAGGRVTTLDLGDVVGSAPVGC